MTGDSWGACRSYCEDGCKRHNPTRQCQDTSVVDTTRMGMISRSLIDFEGSSPQWHRWAADGCQYQSMCADAILDAHSIQEVRRQNELSTRSPVRLIAAQWEISRHCLSVQSRSSHYLLQAQAPNYGSISSEIYRFVQMSSWGMNANWMTAILSDSRSNRASQVIGNFPTRVTVLRGTLRAIVSCIPASVSSSLASGGQRSFEV
jgi:hypothetical protein